MPWAVPRVVPRAVPVGVLRAGGVAMLGPGGLEGMKDLAVALALLSAPAALLVVYGTRGPEGDAAGPPRPVAAIEEGRIAFVELCARCHGRYARGGPGGPSLVTPPVRSMPDMAIRRAVRRCSVEHVAPGDMPSLSDLSEAELDHIVAYLREMQRLEARR